MRRLASSEAAWTWGSLAVLLVVAGALIYAAGRGSTFFRDEWHFILHRRGHSAETILRPDNGHSISLQLIVYKVLLQTAGLKSYAAYRTLSVLLHLLVATLLFVFARRRVGPGPALLVTAIFVIPGTASDAALWPAVNAYLGSIAAGIGALLALGREDRRGDLIACVLVVIALASSGLGVAIVVAVLVYCVVGPDSRARAVRVLAAPLLIYLVWYLAYGLGAGPEYIPATEPPGADQSLKENLFDAPGYVANAAASALAATLGLESPYGPALALGAAVLLGLRLGRPGVSAELWALMAWVLAFWGLLALTRGEYRDFGAPRYLYPGAVCLLLIGVEGMRGLRLSRRGLAWAAIGAAAIVVVHVGALRDQGGGFRVVAQELLPQLTALELARDYVDPSFKPVPDFFSPGPDIIADRYFAAIDDFGSPAPSPEELARAPDPQRRTFDGALLRALRVQALLGEPIGDAGPAPQVLEAPPLGARVERSCVVIGPSTSRGAVVLGLTSPGLSITTSKGPAIELRARRLADTFGQPFATAPGGNRAVLRFPADRLKRPWHVEIRAIQPVRACGLT